MIKPSKELQSRPQWARRLAHLRQLHGLSQAKFGASIGVSKEAYQLYEKGAREPRYATLTKLATTYKICLDVLICGRISAEFDFAAAPEEEKRRYLEAALKATAGPQAGGQPQIPSKAPPRVQFRARTKPQ